MRRGETAGSLSSRVQSSGGDAGWTVLLPEQNTDRNGAEGKALTWKYLSLGIKQNYFDLPTLLPEPNCLAGIFLPF